MIRTLDGLVLIKEINMINGTLYSAKELQKMYPDKIVVIRHTSYIYSEVLCDVAKNNVTILDDYVQLGELIEVLSVNKLLFSERISFMKKTKSKIFDYITVSNIIFIKLDKELKYLFQNFHPYLVRYGHKQNDEMLHCHLLGDLKIGFY